MRWVIVVLLGILFANPAIAGEYVVLSGVPEGDPYDKAAARLAAHHGAGKIVRFDPEKPESALAALKEAAPRNVAVVVRPEQIDVNSVRRFLRMATQVDADLFVDFAYGFITGATPEDALAFVETIIRAGKTKQPRKVGSAGVWGGTGQSQASDGHYELGALKLPQRTLRFRAPAGQERDQPFIDAELPSLAGCGAIIMGGHGMPWEIGHGPRAEDIGKLRLFPAVAFNYACHTGVTRRYPQREYSGGNVVERLMEVERKRSFALNMIKTGITGYVAYVNPRPAGPELSTDFARVLAGASLGESRRADYAKILLGYLGWGEKGIVPPEWEDGRTKARKAVDPVRHMMLDGATGGILYGDPAFRPFERNAESLPLAKAVKGEGEDLIVAFALAERHMGIWCADPFRKFPGGLHGMARKLYGKIELPADAPLIRSVWIDTATQGGKPIRTLAPVWALEEDDGKRYLHVKANFDYGARGDVAVRFVASSRAEVPEAKRPKPLREMNPADFDLPGLVRHVNTLALNARTDITAWLRELGSRPKPHAFDHVVALIRRGQGHWRTHLLLDVTKSTGDEKKLMALVGGPALPRYGRWIAMKGLGLFDLSHVRAFLLEQVARGRDAGLFMSAAQALAMLQEEQAHTPIAKQLLAFEEGWSGVEGHLLNALHDIGAPALAETLDAYVRHERATQEMRVWVSLDRLKALDAKRAVAAAKALTASARFAEFAAGTQARIRELAGMNEPSRSPK